MRLNRVFYSLTVGITFGIGQVAWSQNVGFDFSLRTFRSLAKTQGANNFIFSPYAVRSALGVAAAGARGKTLRQLGKAPEAWASKKDPAYKLAMANRLWVHMGYPLNEPYMDMQEKTFGSRPWMVDFTKGPDFLRDRVNGWVSEKTQGKIKSMITEDSIEPTMRMMLTSAIYFKGDWVYPFERSETQEGRFVSESDPKARVSFMHKTGSFNYVKTRDAQVLELPYLDGEIAIDLVLPDSENSLAAYESALSAESVDRSLAELTVQSVQIAVPKFSFNSNLDLREPLKSIGIVDPFTPELADFSAMNGNHDLSLSAFYQQTSIGVNEEVTEAASRVSSVPTRGLASETKNLPSQLIKFRLDRPFVFLIRHRGTNSILFLGHVVQPTLMTSQE